MSGKKGQVAARLARLPEFCMELLFPARCPFCDAVLGFSGPCADCAQTLRTAARMPGTPVPAEGHETQWIDAVYAPYLYDSIVQSAILRMKFHGRPDLARPLAERMAETLRAAGPSLRAEILGPVPSGHKELRGRGYDVPLNLARLLGKELRLPVVQALCKTRETTRQATLSGEERRRNLNGVFAVREAAPAALGAAAGGSSAAGRHILLVDDVYTTGTTLNACAGALKTDLF